MILRRYIDAAENREARRKLPPQMVDSLLPGGSGLGVLALIFEIAADVSASPLTRPCSRFTAPEPGADY